MVRMVLRHVEAEAAGDGQVAGGGDRFRGPTRSGIGRQFRGQDVAGDLLADELVVRLVGVEGVDDVVAVAPGLGHGEVGRLAGRVGVADHVEPVPAPLLAVGRRRQQPVHELVESVRRAVGEEGVDLVRRRRQPGQVERDAADERELVGRRSRLQAALAPRSGEEGVEGMAGGRRLRVAHRLERPVLDGLHRLGGGGPSGPVADPAFQVGDGRGVERLVRRHRLRAGPALDRGDEQTFRGLAGDDGRPVVAAFGEARGRVEAQTGRRLVGAVALDALVGQDGADLGLEEGVVGRRGGEREREPGGGRGSHAGSLRPVGWGRWHVRYHRPAALSTHRPAATSLEGIE